MSTPSLPRDFEIVREVGHITEDCAYGDKHKVTYVEHRYVSPTGETREYDNGYTKDQTHLVADRGGKIYHQHPPTDFYGPMVWIRDGDNARFRGGLPTGSVRLVSGHSLQNCPDGPAWKDVVDPVVTNQTAVEQALRALGLEATPGNIARVLAMKDQQDGDQS